MNGQDRQPNSSSPLWRRALILVAGGAVLAAGVVMLVLPGPAIVFIPLGLAILATEFRWARRWLVAARQWIRRRFVRRLTNSAQETPRISQVPQSFKRVAAYGDINQDPMTTEPAVVDSKLAERLAAHPFTKGMQPHHIETLSKSAVLKQFEAGEVIFRTGGPATGFYLVETGAVVIEATKHRAKPIAIDTVHAGEPLGWSWLFEPYVWEFDARATEPTTAIFFSRENMWRHHTEDLTLGHELFKRISQVMVRRLHAARRKFVAEGESSRS
ncbi:MAG: PGPGW domain-containing protein [Chthoniobacterales bacterium]